MTAQPIGRMRRMTGEDRRYYLGRAEAELALAQLASHPGAVSAHYRMAEHYLDRVYGAPDTDPA